MVSDTGCKRDGSGIYFLVLNWTGCFSIGR